MQSAASVPGFSSTPTSACRRYATSPPPIVLRIHIVRHPSDCPIGAIHRHRRKTAEERFNMLARSWLAYPVTPMHAHLPPKSGCRNVIPRFALSRRRATALFRNPVCKAQRSVPGFSSTPNSACRRYATSPPSAVVEARAEQKKDRWLGFQPSVSVSLRSAVRLLVDNTTLFDTSLLACKVAQIVQFCTTHFTKLVDCDAVDKR